MLISSHHFYKGEYGVEKSLNTRLPCEDGDDERLLFYTGLPSFVN